MPSLNTIRRITVEGRTTGMPQVVAELRGVSRAQEEVARASETTARATDTLSRRQLSASGAWARLRAEQEGASRAGLQYQKDLRTINAALSQNADLAEEAARAVRLSQDAYQAAGTRSAPTVDQSGINGLLGVRDAAGGAARASASVFEAELERLDDIARLRSEEAGVAFRQGLEASLVPGVAKSAREAASVFEAELSRMDDIARMAAQEAGAEFQRGLNERMGVGAPVTSARASASVFEEQAREADQMAVKANALRASLDPVVAAQQRLNAEMAEYSTLAAHGVITTGELSQAHAMATTRFNAASGAVDGVQKKTGLATHQMTNLGFQVNDIGTMLASGSSPFQVMATQGGQIYQILSSAPGGVGAALKDVGSATVTWIGRLAPLAAVVGLGAAAFATLRSEMNEGRKNALSFGDVFLGVFQSIGDGLANMLGLDTVSKAFDQFWDDVTQGFTFWFNATARGADRLGINISAVLQKIPLEVEVLVASLPQSFQDAGQKAANVFIGAMEAMINSVLDKLHVLTDALSAVPGMATVDKFIPKTVELTRVDLAALSPSDATAKMAAIDAQRAKDLAATNSKDYSGAAYASIMGNAEENQADRIKDKTTRSRRPRESDYDREIENLKNRTAAMEADTRAVGLSTFAAEKLRATMDLENAARKDAIGLSPARIAQINAESTAYAEQALALEKAQEAQQRLDDVRDAYRDGMTTFVSTFRDGLKSGEGFWTSFADAAVAALDRVTERLTDMAMNSALDALVGKQGTTGTGMLGGLLGGLFSGGVGSPISLGTPGGIAGNLSAIRHTGGIVGEFGMPSRYVHPAYFDDAPRFHGGGIVGRERPIIANEDEGVFTRGQMRALGLMASGGAQPASGGITVNNYGKPDQVEVQRDDNGNTTVNVFDVMERDMASRVTSGRGPLSRASRMAGGNSGASGLRG